MLLESPMKTPERAPATTMAATKKMTCVVPESDILSPELAIGHSTEFGDQLDMRPNNVGIGMHDQHITWEPESRTRMLSMLNSDMDGVSIVPLINRSSFAGSRVVVPVLTTVIVPFTASST